MKKIIIYNLYITLTIIISIELIFGYWFDKYNFGIHMRKHRNKLELYEAKFNEKEYKFYYKRNFHGFRGEEIKNLSKINYVFLGGSTGNERFLPEELTIIGNLNNIFKKNNDSEIFIHNASVDGKTLRGHYNDFEHWFTKLKNFKPKYFLIYVGINDSVINQAEKYDLTIGNNNFKKLRDYVSNNSIIVELIKKIIWKYSKSTKLKYEINDQNNLYNDNYYYTEYFEAKQNYNLKFLHNKYSYLSKRFKERLDNILVKVRGNDAKIIFITQIKYDGLKDEKLFLLNEITKEFSEINKVDLIKLDEKYFGEKFDFYDPVHTTPKGSKRIAEIIYKDLKKIISP
tara:strand:- start:170 stop:1195 length:1026 start_codon:yes stop_codon:yes gene_type:complete